MKKSVITTRCGKLRFKLAIFDLDGTICDTIPDLTTGINMMRGAFGFPPITESDVKKHINNGADLLTQRCLPENFPKERYAEAKEIYLAAYSKCYKEKTYPYKGMREAVERLRSAGMKTAVFSNKGDAHVRGLVESIYPSLFDFTLGDGIYPVKPDPAGALAIAKRFACSVGECVLIGDSHIDMQTACNAKMYKIGVSWGYRPPELLVENGADAIAYSPEELASLILGETQPRL